MMPEKCDHRISCQVCDDKNRGCPEVQKRRLAELHKPEAAKSNSSGLLCCPDCGLEAINCCIANQTKAREPYEKNCASMVCNNCGYAVTVKTRNSPLIIRKMWGMAAIQRLELKRFK